MDYKNPEKMYYCIRHIPSRLRETKNFF